MGKKKIFRSSRPKKVRARQKGQNSYPIAATGIQAEIRAEPTRLFQRRARGPAELRSDKRPSTVFAKEGNRRLSGFRTQLPQIHSFFIRPNHHREGNHLMSRSGASSRSTLETKEAPWVPVLIGPITGISISVKLVRIKCPVMKWGEIR